MERTDTPENINPALLAIGEANISEHDIGKFQTQLSKTTATGGQFSFTHTVAYDKDRFPYTSHAPYAYPSDWNVNLRPSGGSRCCRGGRAVQPHRRAGGRAGQFNGVMLARINTDIALADFEAAVRNLVSDVETPTGNCISTTGTLMR